GRREGGPQPGRPRGRRRSGAARGVAMTRAIMQAQRIYRISRSRRFQSFKISRCRRVIACFALLSAVAAFAAPQPKQPLTLEECYRIAEQNHPDLATAQDLV